MQLLRWRASLDHPRNPAARRAAAVLLRPSTTSSPSSTVAVAVNVPREEESEPVHAEAITTRKPLQFESGGEFLESPQRHRIMDPILRPSCVPNKTFVPPPFTRRVRDQRPAVAVLMVSVSAGATGTSINASRFDLMHKMSFINHAQYCSRHGYDLIVETGGTNQQRGSASPLVDPTRDPKYAKLRALRKHLPRYEHVLYTDLDTLVANYSVTIESIVEESRQRGVFDVVVAANQDGINTGVMLWRRSEYSLALLRRITSVPRELAEEDGFRDQGALNWLLNAGHTRARDPADARAEREHILVRGDEDGARFNALPSQMIRDGIFARYGFRRGSSFVIHFASFRFFSFSMELFKAHYLQSLCDNDALDAVVDPALRIQRASVDWRDPVAQDEIPSDLRGIVSGAELTTAVSSAQSYLPPDAQSATFPPLDETFAPLRRADPQRLAVEDDRDFPDRRAEDTQDEFRARAEKEKRAAELAAARMRKSR